MPGGSLPLLAGNWKMNGLTNSAAELARIIERSPDLAAKVQLMICPPATLLAGFASLARGSAVAIGGQDCHTEPFGAFTGDISAEMLKDAGAAATIVGHSERRIYHRETDSEVRRKAAAAWRAGLTAIVCIGETRAQREAGKTIGLIRGQLDQSLPDGATADNIVVAYEPVWAIGTGLTPTPTDIAEVHSAIRDQLVSRYGQAGQGIRILYGGSVKPSNAADLLRADEVNGALVGGASLKAEDFLEIAAAYR